MIKVSNITESLEGKYLSKYLTEEYLQEKYSDSMPDWLQHRLDYSQHVDRAYNKDSAPYPATKRDIKRGDTSADPITGDHKLDQSSYGTSVGSNTDKADKLKDKYGYRRPSYTYRGSSNSRENQENSLYYNFRKMGIPLDKVKVVEGPMPTKGSDERLQEPNIPIFLFENGQVYAKGVNDAEEYIGDNSYKPFKYMSMKALLSEAKAFAYIDGSDSTNFNAFDVRAERRSDKGKEWRKYERDKSKAVNDEGKINQGFDKSGYPVPIDKWQKANKTYISQYQGKQLESYRQKLIEVIDDYKVFNSNLFDMLKDKNTNISDDEGYYTRRRDIGNISGGTQKDIYSNIMNAKEAYSDALEAIVRSDNSMFDNNLSRMSKNMNNAAKLMQETGIMPEKLAVIDWI